MVGPSAQARTKIFCACAMLVDLIFFIEAVKLQKALIFVSCILPIGLSMRQFQEEKIGL